MGAEWERRRADKGSQAASAALSRGLHSAVTCGNLADRQDEAASSAVVVLDVVGSNPIAHPIRIPRSGAQVSNAQ